MATSKKKRKGKPNKPQNIGVKKKKKKINWLQIIMLFTIIILFILLAINPASFNKSKSKSSSQSEPKFTKEGQLTFFKKASEKEILTIDIEIADNFRERSLGLMYRKKMSDNVGMLFIMEREEPQSFWMKNTYISLDILYLDKDLNIVTIQRDTQPLSMKSIPSYKKAKFVVEVLAGFCELHGIEEGDYIKYQRLPIASADK